MNETKGIKQRRQIADYLNVGESLTPEFVFCGAGFTDLNENPSAQVGSKKYIHDKSNTKGIKGYDWSMPFVTDQIRSEKAVAKICDVGEYQRTGADAETEFIRVDLDMPVAQKSNVFKARRFKIAIEVASFGNNDGELTATGNFLGIGDMIAGEFDTTSRTFTAEEDSIPGELGILSVMSETGTSTGDTKVTILPSLTQGNSYKYKTAASITLPSLDQSCATGWTVWNGTADITATTGHKIAVIEIDSQNKAKKGGLAVVTAKA